MRPDEHFAERLVAASDQRTRAALVEFARLQLLHSVTRLGSDEDDAEPFGWQLTSDFGGGVVARQKSAQQAGAGQNSVAGAAGSVSPSHQVFRAHRSYADQQPENPTGRAVERASAEYRLDSRLIHAVIRAESNYDQQAVSPAGAQGLMQLMPTTARELGVTDPFDPEQNVMGGARYLRQMLDRYDGHLDSALAAYNWGPGNVDRNPGRLPHETRQYIARIKSYLDAAGPQRG